MEDVTNKEGGSKNLMDTDKDVNATLSSLYHEYERQFRHLFRNDRETLFSMAKAYKPDLTDDATKADCANIIMQNSRLAKRINALEQVRDSKAPPPTSTP